METVIKYMLKGDISQVVECETWLQSPITKDEVISIRDDSVNAPMVIEEDGEFVGYGVYKLRPNYYELTNLTICQSQLRKGFGTKFVQRLINSLSTSRRHTIVVNIPDDVGNYIPLPFFQKNGFTATCIRNQRIRMVYSRFIDIQKYGNVFPDRV